MIRVTLNNNQVLESTVRLAKLIKLISDIIGDTDINLIGLKLKEFDEEYKKYRGFLKKIIEGV